MERVPAHVLLQQLLRRERNEQLPANLMEPWQGVYLAAMLLQEQIVPEDAQTDVVTDLINASKQSGEDESLDAALAGAIVGFGESAVERLQIAAATFEENDTSDEARYIRDVLTKVVELTAEPPSDEGPATAVPGPEAAAGASV